MNEREILLRRAAFGQQVEEFWKSDIGSYLLHRIDLEVKEGVSGLKSCDPKDGKTVQNFQNVVYRAESIKQWMEDAIKDGLTAIEIIEGEE